MGAFLPSFHSSSLSSLKNKEALKKFSFCFPSTSCFLLLHSNIIIQLFFLFSYIVCLLLFKYYLFVSLRLRLLSLSPSLHCLTLRPKFPPPFFSIYPSPLNSKEFPEQVFAFFFLVVSTASPRRSMNRNFCRKLGFCQSKNFESVVYINLIKNIFRFYNYNRSFRTW